MVAVVAITSCSGGPKVQGTPIEKTHFTIIQPDGWEVVTNDDANVEIKLLPSISFNVGGSAVTIDEMELYPPTGDRLYTHDGRMGMSLVRLFRKTTINLNDMYIKFE